MSALFQDRAAQFSNDGTCRFTLSHWWKESPQRLAAWLMLNPSTADADRDDPTTRRVTHFSKAWGYDGWVIVNCFPFVSSQPDVMWARVADGRAETGAAMLLNLMHVTKVARSADLRVVAFGNGLASHSEQLDACLEAFRGRDAVSRMAGMQAAELVCLGTTLGGWPLHPLARGRSRVPDDRLAAPWSRP